MFKVKKTEYTSKTFRLPNGLLCELEKIAQKNGISVNNLMVQCCEYALNNIDEEEKDDNIIFRTRGNL